MSTTVTVGTGSGGVASLQLAMEVSFLSSLYVAGFDVTPATILAPNSSASLSSLSLSSGDTQVTPPSNASVVIIQPAASNTATLKLKGAVGDTGIKIHKTAPTVYSLDPTQTSFYINASTTAPVVVCWI